MPKAGQFRRAWDGEEWQSYARTLIALRHGSPNVQSIPDHVQGDAGLECFTMDGCAYQCYAPEEVSDTKKAANAMKGKASRDLQKLQKNQKVLKRLLQDVKISRWVLLAPFLDDKDVVAFTRERGTKLRSVSLPFLSADFEAIVHSQEDFMPQIGFLKAQPINPHNAVRVSCPPIEIEDGELAKRIEDKLLRAYPSSSQDQIKSKAAQYVIAHAQRAAALVELRREYPILWETSITCITTEESRLTLVGAQGAAPSDQLRSSLDRIESNMSRDLPNLAPTTVSAIAQGTLSDWLIRCPLDFIE